MPSMETVMAPPEATTHPATISGWDVATGEYVVRTTSGAADDGDAGKARWRGIKGLDAECC